MIDPINIFAYRLIHPHVRMIHPPSTERGSAVGASAGSMDAGMKCYRPIMDAIDKYYEAASESRDCSISGAVPVAFYNIFARRLRVYASDIDETAIAYIRQAYPSVRSNVSNLGRRGLTTPTNSISCMPPRCGPHIPLQTKSCG